MGKRSNFERRERDFYPTPISAVEPLLAHINNTFAFEEPCAGAGDLVDHLERSGHWCRYSCDIEPQRGDISKFDVFDIKKTAADVFITNPPWPRPGQKGQPTVDIANHLSAIAPTWLLLSADFAHNKYFKQMTCSKIVSVGRVSWMENGTSGKDNCAWYLFDKAFMGQTRFFERL